jgi:hypothetical protein
MFDLSEVDGTPQWRDTDSDERALVDIDRNKPTSHPVRFHKPWYPEYVCNGPHECNPHRVRFSALPSEVLEKKISRTYVFYYLVITNGIKHCLDLRMGEELKKAPSIIPASWDGVPMFLWKSVMHHRRDINLYVPVLLYLKKFGTVTIAWENMSEMYPREFDVPMYPL